MWAWSDNSIVKGRGGSRVSVASCFAATRVGCSVRSAAEATTPNRNSTVYFEATFGNFRGYPMPLLHQDNSRGGGGSRENRRSLAEFLGLDASQLAEAATPTTNREGDEWHWENPRSPEAAQTAAFHSYSDGMRLSEWGDEAEQGIKDYTSLEAIPYAPPPRVREARSPAAAQTPRAALVPPTCFPPRHPTAFASYSENARLGGWGDNETDHGITELVTSLKALAMPPAAIARNKSFHMKRLSCDALETVESLWPPEGAHAHPQDESRLLSRRASFCGVVSSARNGGSVRWHGALPARGAAGPAVGGGADAGYSPKLFLGGLPYDITEQALMHALRHFQPVRVDWPGRGCVGGGAAAGGGGGAGAPRGCAYVTLEGERRVRALLAACRRDGHDWYYRLATRNMRTKEVQVIPWAVSDSNWVVSGGGGGAPGSVRLEPGRTVFVGALHGMLSASALAIIMNDLFSGVIYAGIDTDKNKYPIGSGRVTFNNVRSYVRAISAAYVEICTDKFTKKVQVDPYLEDSMCSVCNLQQGPYFCREPMCFRYFCRSCWAGAHASEQHKPLMRNCKSAVLPPGPPPPPTEHGVGYNGFGNTSNNDVPPPPGGEEAR